MLEDLRQQLEHLHGELAVLADRVSDMEQAFLAVKRRVPVPWVIPVRHATKIALAVSTALAVVALALAFSPQTITIGGVLYSWPGVTAETIAALGAAVGVWITIREHLKDKKDFRDRGDE
jgi:hypothetical protein